MLCVTEDTLTPRPSTSQGECLVSGLLDLFGHVLNRAFHFSSRPYLGAFL